MTAQQAQEFLAEITDNSLPFRTLELYKCTKCFPILHGLGSSVLFKNCVYYGWETFTHEDKLYLLLCLEALIVRLESFGWRWRYIELWKSWTRIYKTLKEKWRDKKCPFEEDRFYEDRFFTNNNQARLLQLLLMDEVKERFSNHQLCYTWSDITECFIVEVVPKIVNCADPYAVDEVKVYYKCKPYKIENGIKIKYTEISYDAYFSWRERYGIGGISSALNMAEFYWDWDHNKYR